MARSGGPAAAQFESASIRDVRRICKRPYYESDLVYAYLSAIGRLDEVMYIDE